MKRFIAKGIWIGIVIISILLILLGLFGAIINIREIAPYYSYPKTEARVLDVHNYQKSSQGQDIEYGSRIQLEYTVQGKQVISWRENNRDSILEAGDIITIAYNPDNPTDCNIMEKPDTMIIIALIPTIIFIALMSKKALAPSKEKGD